MRFRDPNVLPVLAKAILKTLGLPEDHSDDMKQYRLKVLNCQCRELEKFLRLRKSVAAQQKADQLGIGDLSKFVWADQTKKRGMGDLGREFFHFEHTFPVAVLVRKLTALHDPTIDDVQAIIAMAEVTWITKEEDRELTRLKLRHTRDDPREAYELAKIELCED